MTEYNLKELNESAKEDSENAISDDLETPNFQKFVIVSGM